jgi:hypothetical protein
MASAKSGTRRSVEDRVADLQAQIAKIKAKAEQMKVKKDPSLRHISGALRSIDKAIGETGDKATRAALAEARACLSACLSLNGSQPGSPATRQRRDKPDPERVLAFVRKHPGARSEEICAELGTETAALRPVLHQLRDDGKISVEGKARATRYQLAMD